MGGSWLVVPPDALEDLLPRLALHPRVETERRRSLRIHPTHALKAGLGYHDGPGGLEPGVDYPIVVDSPGERVTTRVDGASAAT